MVLKFLEMTTRVTVERGIALGKSHSRTIYNDLMSLVQLQKEAPHLRCLGGEAYKRSGHIRLNLVYSLEEESTTRDLST
jgi:hypothetical protein